MKCTICHPERSEGSAIRTVEGFNSRPFTTFWVTQTLKQTRTQFINSKNLNYEENYSIVLFDDKRDGFRAK